MSAAAIQAAAQHIPTSSYPSPPTSRQYMHSQIDNDEAYYLNQDAAASASSQASRQHRRNHTAQSSSSARNVSQDQDREYARQAPSHHATTTIPVHTRNHSAPTDQYDGPPVPPPRLSSQQSPNSTTGSSRNVRHNTDRSGGQDANIGGDYDDPMRERLRDDAATGTTGAARTRRKGPTSPETSYRAAGSRERGEHASPTTHNRSDTTIPLSGPPPPLVRENSEVIGRIVISDPQVDHERIQERIAEAQPMVPGAEASPMMGSSHGESGRGPQRRQDYSKSSSRRKDVQFGNYVLGQTLGEGEFGKVKLGWKKDGSTQVAIKLIRRESVATNPTRLPKIYREISILSGLAHPNIVRLHEMVETERHIGIILEYASGGELFDYILNQHYLKDPSARRLFAQLVSGVGYLHKKGIVHRDLKLENLLLDQNKNIIITDFGFANTFNPVDDLSPEIEHNLSSKEFVRKYKLDRLDANGMRKGDLMQTSCGSPCYAAPELVVSDSLYTGRKVDVWSCGVILYAMLAGYLPFDDDPANPEGDNINLLYKYITTTPLTFPEYVSPHAKDLLRRILVPDPRKRADLFEVARHSWLNEYHHVVAHITSSTTSVADIANSTVGNETPEGSVILPRSASVRAPRSSSPRIAPQPAGSPQPDYQDDISSSKRDRTARHTLQPEYVAPQTETQRGGPSGQNAKRSEPYAVMATPASSSNKQLPPEPSIDRTYQTDSSQANTVRPGRDVPRSTSDNTGGFAVSSGSQNAHQYVTRPSTQGSMTSASGPGTTRSDLRLPSRGSYGQPVAPTVATTNVQGKVTQPAKNSRGYNISGPVTQHATHASIGQPINQSMPPPSAPEPRPGHHRRSSTLSNLGERLFGRSASVHRKDKEEPRQKTGRKYPPTAMKDPYPTEPQPRMSTDSKRSFSFGLRKKESAEMEGYDEKPRRFSLLPSSMSFKGLLGGSRDQLNDNQSASLTSSQQSNRPPTRQNQPPTSSDGQQDRRFNNFSRPPQAQYRQHAQQPSTSDVYGGTGVYNPEMSHSQSQGQSVSQTQDGHQGFPQYPEGFESRTSIQQGRSNKNVLVKPNRRFNDAYDNDPNGHASSGAVRKVQDFFRRRGRARADSGYR